MTMATPAGSLPTMALLLALLSAAALSAAQPGQRLSLQCAVFYTPERAIWQRQVELTHDAQRVRALRIDGQTPYAFSSDGQHVYTALDNERIHIDLAQGLWRSDFRGLASGEGHCVLKP